MTYVAEEGLTGNDLERRLPADIVIQTICHKLRSSVYAVLSAVDAEDDVIGSPHHEDIWP